MVLGKDDSASLNYVKTIRRIEAVLKEVVNEQSSASGSAIHIEELPSDWQEVLWQARIAPVLAACVDAWLLSMTEPDNDPVSLQALKDSSEAALQISRGRSVGDSPQVLH